MKIERKVVNDMGPDHVVAHINLGFGYTGIHAQKGKPFSLDFEMKTYNSLHLKKGEEAWLDTFDHINRLFKLMSKDDHLKIYEFYIKCQQLIEKVTEEKVQELVQSIASATRVLIHDINLPEVAMDYVHNHSGIKLPKDLEKVGARPHDVKELTFRSHEYWNLTALGVICKMFAPIWGLFASKVGPIVQSRNKEFYCFLGFRPVLEHPVFLDVHDKLSYYIESNIKRCLQHQQSMSNRSPFDVSFSLINKGFGVDRFRDYVYAGILIKKIVTYNPDTPESNIMTFLYVNTSYTADQMVKGKPPSNSVTVMVRRSVTDNNDSDEDSVTALENESRVSKVPADTLIYAKLCATHAVKRLLKEYKITKTLFEEVRSYYARHLVKLSPFSKTILTTMFGKEIGGAKTIEYLTIMPAIELISLAQIRMCNYVHPQIIHMMTSAFPDEDKDEVYSSIDGRIRLIYPESQEFKECQSEFTHNLGANLNISEQIKSCADFVTDYHHFYNTAPAICEILEQENIRRGEKVEYDEYIMNQFCAFLLAQTQDVKPTLVA